MSAWILNEGNGIAYYTIEEWRQAGVDIAFSTRTGGSSTGAFNSANMGLHVEDEQERVISNREKFLANVRLELGQAVCCRQVHGDRIIRVDKQHQGRGVHLYDTSLPDYDGLVTNQPGVALLSFYADCVPVYLFDPDKRAIGMVHSGWKGTMQRIAEKAVTVMQKEYGSQAGDLWAAIGPGIGDCCFEISPVLADEVKINFPDYEDIINFESGRFCWNLTSTIRQILLQAGINSNNISICSLCTACNPDLFFSYRRDKGMTGRMGALLNLTY
ncbi:MAG TPA: peptidoglycan editing factor PgeF [Syntrophomonas sp.]|nr:peptidoglycan editing factor PgeF [Syntrophomonas sp.]